jgi:hypothetical protein
VKHLSGFPLQGKLLALPTNVGLGWKGVRGTNTLAYFTSLTARKKKKFHYNGTGGLYYKHYELAIYGFRNKLVCLSKLLYFVTGI